ncbi:MAG: hypothetical protein WCF43_04360, partial [Steroidobacteraceae bacterium]
MNKKGVALVALAGFGLGMLAGKGLAAFGAERAADANEPAAAMVSLPAGHPRVTERGLGDAVVTTLQMRVAPAANASAMIPGAVSHAGSPDLIAQADDLRRQRKFKEAAEAYRRAAAAG